MVAVRGKYDGKSIVLSEPLDIPRGQEVIVHVQVPPDQSNGPSENEHILDWVVKNLTADDDVPRDGSAQHDHYIYGTPKRKP